MTASTSKEKKKKECWIGIDGTRTGWVAFIWQADGDHHLWHIKRLQELQSLADTYQVNAIGIDIPIGLLEVAEMGGRGCDREARKLLSTAKRNALKHDKSSSSAQGVSLVGPSSIFTPPCRKALRTAFPPQDTEGGTATVCACTHAQVSAANKDSVLGAKSIDDDTDTTGDGLGLSIQTFHILPKIQEADQFVSTSEIAGSKNALALHPAVPVLECHPELAFLSLSQQNQGEGDELVVETTALYSKKVIQGRRQRLALLCKVAGLAANELLSLATFKGENAEEVSSESALERLSELRTWRLASLTEQVVARGISVAADDVLDAMVCASTSKRWSMGQAKAVSEHNDIPYDNRNLPMLIWT